MGARSPHDAGPAAGAGGEAEGCEAEGCGFPTCERDSVTERGMCQLHQRVAISRTGSWLEAG